MQEHAAGTRLRRRRRRRGRAPGGVAAPATGGRGRRGAEGMLISNAYLLSRRFLR